MAQKVQFSAPAGHTLTMRLFEPGSDLIAHSSAGLVGGPNDKTAYIAADVDEGITGIHHLSAVDGSSNVKAEGWVDLSGITDALHVYGSYQDILKLQSQPRKNRAFNNFSFIMYATDGKTPLPGLTVTGERSLDTGAFSACANSAVEVGNGWYRINLTAADLNGDIVRLRFTGGGTAAPTNIFMALGAAA